MQSCVTGCKLCDTGVLSDVTHDVLQHGHPHGHGAAVGHSHGMHVANHRIHTSVMTAVNVGHMVDADGHHHIVWHGVCNGDCGGAAVPMTTTCVTG